MKNNRLWIPSVLFLLFALLTVGSRSAWGQSNQDGYASYSTDGEYLYTTVVVEGEVASYLYDMEHTYYAYNMLGGKGGLQADMSANYVSIVNDQELPIAPGDDIEWDYEYEVYCPYAGDFFNSSGTSFFKMAHTTYKVIGCGQCILNPDGGVMETVSSNKACPAGTTETCPGPVIYNPVMDTCGCAPWLIHTTLVLNGWCTPISDDTFSQSQANCQ